MMISLLLLIGMASAADEPASAQPLLHILQEDGELNRLARQQRRTAEQVRRLGGVFKRLELRATQEGDLNRATHLAEARLRLEQAQETGDLAQALDGIAQELTAQRPGVAAEQQAIALAALRDLLDFLIREETRQQAQDALEKAQEHAESLAELAKEQKELLHETQSQIAKDAPPELAKEDVQQLAEAQKELADRIQESENDSEKMAGEKAAEAADALLENNLEKAEGKQQEALDELEDAAKEAAAEADAHQKEMERQELLDVAKASAEFLARHEVVREMMVEMAQKSNALTRRERMSLREGSEGEFAIEKEAKALMFQIADSGSALFPFLIKTLRQDHKRLAQQLAPPSHEVSDSSLSLAAALSERWENIIDAFLTEADRNRPKAESPEGEGDGEPPESPLVQFSVEVELLKRMQIELTEQMANAKPDDWKWLLERQRELRQTFEDMIQALQEDEAKEDDA
jgi:hypothetical protein